MSCVALDLILHDDRAHRHLIGKSACHLRRISIQLTSTREGQWALTTFHVSQYPCQSVLLPDRAQPAVHRYPHTRFASGPPVTPYLLLVHGPSVWRPGQPRTACERFLCILTANVDRPSLDDWLRTLPCPVSAPLTPPSRRRTPSGPLKRPKRLRGAIRECLATYNQKR